MIRHLKSPYVIGEGDRGGDRDSKRRFSFGSAAFNESFRIGDRSLSRPECLDLRDEYGFPTGSRRGVRLLPRRGRGLDPLLSLPLDVSHPRESFSFRDLSKDRDLSLIRTSVPLPNVALRGALG